MRTTLAATILLALWSTTAHAQDGAPQEDAPQEAVIPTIMHVPPATAMAGQPITLKAVVSGDWRLERIWVAFRAAGEGTFREVDMGRAVDNTFAVVLPGTDLQPPAVEYYIASEAKDGALKHHFASDMVPHTVLVQGETEETLFNERLANHGGRRSAFKVDSELTAYGRRLFEPGFGEEGVRTDAFSDLYWNVEAEYTYRILSTLYDIRFGLGAMRGQRSTATVDGEAIEIDTQFNPEPDPGLNYGWSEANFELHRNFSLGAKLILGASEDGFAAGLGGVLRIGPIAGTHLAFGGEVLQDAGNTGFMRFAWTTLPKIPMALTIEVSEAPDANANPLGTRMMLDIGWNVFGGLTVEARIGYAARNESLEGGPIAGLGTTWEF